MSRGGRSIVQKGAIFPVSRMGGAIHHDESAWTMGSVVLEIADELVAVIVPIGSSSRHPVGDKFSLIDVPVGVYHFAIPVRDPKAELPLILVANSGGEDTHPMHPVIECLPLVTVPVGPCPLIKTDSRFRCFKRRIILR